MLLFEIILIAIGLSMDSLAVYVTSGAVLQKCSTTNMVKMGMIMGLAQAGMTAIGYLSWYRF